MKDSGVDPTRVDVVRLADRAQTLQGKWPGAALTRLAVDTLGVLGEVDWSATGEFRAVPGSKSELWVHLSAKASVALSCQRCLQGVDCSLLVTRSIRFVRDEAEAERLDEELDDDVLALQPNGLDLQALVEDELILALPLVPKHDECSQPLAVSGDEATGQARENPFLALAALKGKMPPKGGAA